MYVTVALLAIVRGVWACAEPTLMAQSLYDSSTGGAVYNGGFACAYSGAQASTGEFMCLLSANGNTLDLIGASQPSHAPPFQCCANDPVSNLALCLGGLTTDSRLFRFNLTSRLWLDAIDIPPLLALRSGHSCSVSKGNLFVFGGVSSKGVAASPTTFSISLEAYAVRTDYSAPASAARVGHVAVTLPSDDILVLFGSTSPPPVAQLPTLVFSPENGSWSEYSSKTEKSSHQFPQTLDGASCTAWSSSENLDGGVFCYGGRDVVASNPIPYLTYLNLSSSSWSNLGSPPTSSGQNSGTFGSSVSLLNGGSVIVVKSGGSALSTNIYTSANVAKNFACSSGDANDGFGNFYGVPPLGPGTCGIEGKPQCPSASSVGATNVPAVGSGWITPAPGVGFPVVNPIMKTAVATAVPSKTNISIKTSSVVSNQGDKDANGSDGGGLSGARLGLAIGIPILLLLLCCVGGFLYKKKSADMKKRSEVPARAPLPGNSVDIGMAALPPIDELDRSVEGQGPTYVAPPSAATHTSTLDQNQKSRDITNSPSGETFAKSAVLGETGFVAMASVTKQKFAGVQKHDRSINLIDVPQSSAALRSESVASETLVGASVATAISLQNEKHAPSAEMDATAPVGIGAGRDVSFACDAGDLVHVPLAEKSTIDDVQVNVGTTQPVSYEALHSSRPSEVENHVASPVVALSAAAIGTSAITQTRRKSDAAALGPVIPENSVKSVSKPENHEASASTLSFFGSFFRGSSTEQLPASESLPRDAGVATSESAVTPAAVATSSAVEETSKPMDQNGVKEVFLPPLVSSLPFETVANDDSRLESDAVHDSAEGNPTYFTPTFEPTASAVDDDENPNMISVHESTPRELPSVSELSVGNSPMSPFVALAALSVSASASNVESSDRKDVAEIVTLPQSTQVTTASTAKRSFFGSFFKSTATDESAPLSNQVSKEVTVLPELSDSMTEKPATIEQLSPVTVAGTTYLSAASTDLKNVGKDDVSPELSTGVTLMSSLKQATSSGITTNDVVKRAKSNASVVEDTVNASATAATVTEDNVIEPTSQAGRAIPSGDDLQRVVDNTDPVTGSQDKVQPEMVELHAAAPSESDAPIIDFGAALLSSNAFGPPVKTTSVEVVTASDLDTNSENPGISSNGAVSKVATAVPAILASQKSKKPVFNLFKSKKGVPPVSTETVAADATNVPVVLGEHSSELRSSNLTAEPAKTSIINDPELSADVPLASSLNQNAPSVITKVDTVNRVRSNVTVVEETANASATAAPLTGDDVPLSNSQMERAINFGSDLQPEMVELRAAAPRESGTPNIDGAAALQSSNDFGPPIETMFMEVVTAPDLEKDSEKPGIPSNESVSQVAAVVPVLLDSQKPSKKPVFKLFKSKKAVSPASTDSVDADAITVPATREHTNEVRNSTLTAGSARVSTLNDPGLSSDVALASSLKEDAPSVVTSNVDTVNRVGSNVTVVENTKNATDTAAALTGENVLVSISQAELAIHSGNDLQQGNTDTLMGSQYGLQPEMAELHAAATTLSDAPIIGDVAALPSSNDFGPAVETTSAEVASALHLETDSAELGISSNKGVSKMATVVPVLLDSQKPSKKPVFKLFKSKKAVSPASTDSVDADAITAPAAKDRTNDVRNSGLTAGPAKTLIVNDEILAGSSLPASESHERTPDGIASTAVTPVAFIVKNDIERVDSLQSNSGAESATIGGIAVNESGYEAKQTDQDERAEKADEASRRVVIGQNEGGKEDYQTGSKAINLAAPDKLVETSPTSCELDATTAASSEILENLPQFAEDERLPDQAVDRSATAPVSSQSRDISGELVSIGMRPAPNSDGAQENAISNSSNVVAASLSADSKKPPKKALFKMFKSKQAGSPISAVKLNPDIEAKPVMTLSSNLRNQNAPELLAVIEEPVNVVSLDAEIVAISARPAFETEGRGTTGGAVTDGSVVDRATTTHDALKSMEMESPAHSTIPVGDTAASLNVPSVPVTSSEFDSKEIVYLEPVSRLLMIEDDVFGTTLNLADPSVIGQTGISTTKSPDSESSNTDATRKGVNATVEDVKSSQVSSAPLTSTISSRDMSGLVSANPELPLSAKIPALSDGVQVDAVEREINAVATKDSEVFIAHSVDNLVVGTTRSSESSSFESLDSFIQAVNLSSRVTVVAEATNTAKDLKILEGMPNAPHSKSPLNTAASATSMAHGALSLTERKVDNEPPFAVESSGFSATGGVKPSFTEKAVTVESLENEPTAAKSVQFSNVTSEPRGSESANLVALPENEAAESNPEQDSVNVSEVVEGKTQPTDAVASKPKSFFGRILSSVSGNSSPDALNGSLESVPVTSGGSSSIQEQSPSAAFEDNARTSDKTDSNARSSTVVVMEEENGDALHLNAAAGSVMFKDVAAASSNKKKSPSVTRGVKAATSEKAEVGQEVDNLFQNTQSSANPTPGTKDSVTESMDEFQKAAPVAMAAVLDTVSLDNSWSENAAGAASDGPKSSDAEVRTNVKLTINRERPETATDLAPVTEGPVPESKAAKKPIVKLVKVSKPEPKKSFVQILPETDTRSHTDASSNNTGNESLLDDKKQESELIVPSAEGELVNVQVVPQNIADSFSALAATGAQIKIAKKPIVKMVKGTRVDTKEATREHSSITTAASPLSNNVQGGISAVPAQVPKGSPLTSSKSDDVLPPSVIDVASERNVSVLGGVASPQEVSHDAAPVAPKKVAKKIVIAKRKVDAPVISRAAEDESSPSKPISVENTTGNNEAVLPDKANDTPEETMKVLDDVTSAGGAVSPEGISEASMSVLVPAAGNTLPLTPKELNTLTAVTSPISKSDGPQIPVPAEFTAVPPYTARVRSDSVGPQSNDGFDSEIDDRSDAGSAAAESNADSDVTNDGVYFSPRRNTSVSLASELVLGGKRSSIIVRATPTTDLVRSPSRTSLQRPRNSFVYEMTRSGSRAASSSDIRKDARHRLSTVSTPSRRASAAISIATTPSADAVPFGKLAESTGIDSEDVIVLKKRASMSSLSGRSIDSAGKRKSFLESLNDVSSIVSGVSPRRVSSPTDTITAMKLVDAYGSTVSQGWWTRFTEATKALFSGFDGYEFLARNSEIDADRSDDVLMSVFAASGAPVDETEMARCMDQLNASPDVAREFLGDLGSVVQTTSPRHFYYNILPIWNANDLAPAITLQDGLAKMAETYPEFKPDLFAFMAEAKKISPPFAISKFLDAFSTVQGDLSEEKIVACFKFSGADATAEDCKKLLALFSGLWSYDALRDFSQIVRRVGVSTFLCKYREVSKPTVEQSRHSAMAWISSISDMGPKVRFDPLSFQNGCRAINPVFTMNTFLINLAEEEEFLGDVTIRKALSMSGLDLTVEEFEEVMVLGCGDFESRFDVFCGWWQFIRLWGVESYFASVENILVEQRSKNALVMTFLSRIHGLGEDVQFNLRGFVVYCKKQNADFSLQQFCESVRSIPRLESDSLYEAFVESGIDLDPDSVEYKNLLKTLFGDEALAMAAMREWHYILKRLGSEWSVLYMYALVEQHERVQNSVQDFKAEIQAIPVMIDGKPSQVRFTLRSFVEKCKSLKSEWNSDAAADFDLKALLGKLTHISDHGNTVDTLISAFKSVGIYTTDKEYELLIGSIAGGDYLSSLIVFQMLIVFLKKWGMEWNMWIIWSLLDDKEHDDDVLTKFVLHVHSFDPKAKFDLVKFVERCGILENSWQAESSFDLEKFMTGLLAIEGKISLEAVEPVFRSCGIRTNLDEYSDLITTLTGGDFEDISASVLAYWISLVKLWGVQWFMRCGPSFFERFNNAQAAADKLDTALTITDNRLDVRTFEWYCQIKNGGFSLPNFLDALVQSAGKNSSNGNDYMTEDMLLLLLSEQGVELSNEELTNLIGVLTGADGNDGMHIIWEWVLLLRAISVRYFMLAYQVESMWASVNIDTGLAIKAFHSRALYRCERFSVERFLTSVKGLKEDWDVEEFFNYLVEIHGDVSLLHFQQAFKTTDVDVTSDQALDLLSTLTGDEEHALAVGRDWISTAWVVGIRTLLEAEEAIQVEKASEESGGWFFSRVIQAAGSAARAVSGV
ncbi:hypothetical protein HDU81_008357 [Chytriomyces hyalinus]|nr:hypothetical protein HDU81_008357 [Chytriomyces hyalinus]